jgi:hypothetical protein
VKCSLLEFSLGELLEPALSVLSHDQTDHAERDTPQTQVAFDPAIHLAFNASGIERVTMSSLGLDPAIALTDFAYSQPFRLLSPEGVRQSRAELTRREVQQKCRWATKRQPVRVARHVEVLELPQ